MMRRVVRCCLAAAMLSGCGGPAQTALPAAPLQVQMPNAAHEAHAPKTGDGTTLVVGEQGNARGTGFLDIYQAPFTAPPQRIHRDNTLGLVIAPNGALIVAATGGLYVYDPPYTRQARKLLDELYPTGILLFDSKARLFDVDYGGAVYVFDPPYASQPSLTIEGPPELGAAALDGADDVFLTGGSARIYECMKPKYHCKALRISGSVGVDRSTEDLYTTPSSGTIAEFAPPYRGGPIAKAKVPFWPTALRVTDDGAIFVPGLGTRANGYLGVFPHSITGRMLEFPMEAYYRQAPEFWIARNRELFIAGGAYHKPCVAIHPFPYTRAPHQCLATKYPIYAVFAR